MIADVQKHDCAFLLIKKLKEDSVSIINRETPLLFKFPVKAVRVEAGIKRVAPKKRDAFIDKLLQSGIQIIVTMAIPWINVNRHATPLLREFGQETGATKLLCLARPA